MSDIVLSASVRQNLLSLQSTADLLSTTQTRLATGKKVNSALDNPTNFFTAAGLDSRASDINNLLDSIGNGVQVLQAANTGITSLQKLVDSAKSIANQALQVPTGYSTKSEASATITGATAANLLGTTTTTYAAGTFTGSVVQNDKTVAANITGATILGGTSGASSDNLGTAAALNGKTLTINGKTLTFSSSASTDADLSNGGTISTTGTVQDVLDAINSIAGAGTASIGVSNGQISISSGTTAAGVTLGGSALSAFGLNSGTAAGLGSAADGATTINSAGTAIVGVGTTTGGLSGLELDIAATDGGQALKITFGSGTNSFNASTGVATNVSTLDQLNTAGVGSAPVKDANSQNTRASLIAQYNTVIDQIRTTAQDASFNGINLLNGDQLKMVFNETGKSTINITGVTFDPAGLGLGTLAAGSDFVDNSSTNSVLTALNNASTTLRSQASAFGSNLSVVQIRQDFNKNLINVLQTGSANLTLADTNEEAANSQALSTRQSIAVSALALANQSQQSVLQLLR